MIENYKPFFFLLLTKLFLLFVESTSPGHVVLSLRKQVLAFLNLGLCQFVHSVAVRRQILEVLERQLQLTHSLQHRVQSRFLVLEDGRGQFL